MKTIIKIGAAIAILLSVTAGATDCHSQTPQGPTQGNAKKNPNKPRGYVIQATWLNGPTPRHLTLVWNFYGTLRDVSDGSYATPQGDKTIGVIGNHTVTWTISDVPPGREVSITMHEDKLGYMECKIVRDDGVMTDYSHTNGNPNVVTCETVNQSNIA